ncbi:MULTISPECIES: non-ribosomal peptide synthetase [unclassified Bradyrhizobium]|uniref:non-ribosomal peptide synthetase n=1 Tax=unclassified Bradyrhizobium TaxID=2631580 RepID=UPI0028F08238|nr:MULTISPECIES: non-ribosomal peptide synthetase [unclassified Bradyrhizobium]
MATGFRSIVESFEARVSERPGDAALNAIDGRFTFAELNRAANGLARRLIAAGVGPESRVAIVAARTSAWPISIIAVLKAGGAYVPLDARYPQSHLRRIISDVAPVAAIADRAMPAELGVGMKNFIPFEPEVVRGSGEEVNPGVAIAPDGLAYIVYTSGSTGQPNGVMVTHRCIASYVEALPRALKLEAGFSYLHSASFAFSSSVRQLLVPLAQGLCVDLLHDPLGYLSGSSNEAMSVSGQQAILDLTPSLYRQLCAGGLEPGVKLNLGRILSASEPLRGDVARRLQSLGREASRCFNMYGQTETSGIVTTFELTGDSSSSKLPIGRPMENVGVYVLDRNLRPVSVGLAGELYIAGSRLARGYAGQPGLTAERFIPSPFGEGVRLYRTGDLARWRSDGNIEHLGRVDEQVKLRGFRIELGEIEVTLARHPNVREAVAMLRDDTPGEPQLVAYVVMEKATAPVEDLAAFLRGSVPDYMVPTAIVELESLPLTPNGKLDRSVLPRAQIRHEASAQYVAPQTQTEKMVASIWAEVLRLEQVGMNDNFFELGGHSLLATALVAKVSKASGRPLSLLHLMGTPTVAAMVARIEAESSAMRQQKIGAVSDVQ